MTEITKTVIEFVEKTTFEDLPASVVEKTKQVLLDSIGCALGSYSVDRARVVTGLVETLGGNHRATVVGGGRTSCALAAFANAELINALDYDVVGPLCPHIVPQTVATALSMAELAEISGRDLITAVALGLEVGGRIAGSMSALMIGKDESPYWEESPRFTYATSVFGPAISATKTLSLNSKLTANVFGIVGASAPVPAEPRWKHIPGPLAMLKYNCWLGWLAQLAVTATLAAERGFTADTSILDGEHSFSQMYVSSFFKPNIIIEDLGHTWRIEEAHAKPYPCCFINHPFIDAITRIVKENDIEPGDIQSILIKGPPILLSPNRAGIDVRSFSDAQFNPSYSAAVAAYHGCRPNPEWQSPGTFNDPKIRELMNKVRLLIHPEAEIIAQAKVKAGKLPSFYDTIVEVLAKEKTFSLEVAEPRGFGSNQLTQAELEEKFRDNARYSMVRADKVERLISAICELEKLGNTNTLTKLYAME